MYNFLPEFEDDFLTTFDEEKYFRHLGIDAYMDGFEASWKESYRLYGDYLLGELRESGADEALLAQVSAELEAAEPRLLEQEFASHPYEKGGPFIKKR